MEIRCQALMDTVLRPLKNKQTSEIPSALKDSLGKLQRYFHKIIYPLTAKLCYTHSNLDGILADVEQKLKSARLNQAFNHEEYSTMIKSMDIQITQFLELYSVSLV